MVNLVKTFGFIPLVITGSLAGAIAFSSADAQAGVSKMFISELQEVRTGTVDGKEYLTVHINDFVGPANCQGSVLRVDTQSLSQPGKQEAMESVALEAMLKSEPVFITVPMSNAECVNGMPTMTDIDLVTNIQ